MKSRIIIAITALVGAAIVFIVAVYGFGFLQRSTADFRGETDQIEDTEANSDYRIASYDHFYDTCAGVQSLEGKISNMEDELEGTDVGEQRKTTLNTSLTAAKNKRSELINSYNADARKEATKGQFRASDLPYEIDEGEESTVCTAP